jgi:hypothetical protein
MSRKSTIFTPLVMSQVRLMLAMGKNGTQIAQELECDPDSLRAACNRAGIPLRQMRARVVEGSISIKITLTPDISDFLRKEARERGRSSTELAAEIIDAVVGDKLFSAVLDK